MCLSQGRRRALCKLPILTQYDPNYPSREALYKKNCIKEFHNISRKFACVITISSFSDAWLHMYVCIIYRIKLQHFLGNITATINEKIMCPWMKNVIWSIKRTKYKSRRFLGSASNYVDTRLIALVISQVSSEKRERDAALLQKVFANPH